MAKNKVKVNIASKAYTIIGDDSTEHMITVGQLVDASVREIAAEYPSLGVSDRAVLAAINIADEYVKTREKLLRMVEDLTQSELNLNQRLEALTKDFLALEASVEAAERQAEEVQAERGASVHIDETEFAPKVPEEPQTSETIEPAIDWDIAQNIDELESEADEFVASEAAMSFGFEQTKDDEALIDDDAPTETDNTMTDTVDFRADKAAEETEEVGETDELDGEPVPQKMVASDEDEDEEAQVKSFIMPEEADVADDGEDEEADWDEDEPADDEAEEFEETDETGEPQEADQAEEIDEAEATGEEEPPQSIKTGFYDDEPFMKAPESEMDDWMADEEPEAKENETAGEDFDAEEPETATETENIPVDDIENEEPEEKTDTWNYGGQTRFDLDDEPADSEDETEYPDTSMLDNSDYRPDDEDT